MNLNRDFHVKLQKWELLITVMHFIQYKNGGKRLFRLNPSDN